MDALTQEQIDFYWRDGYLVLPHALRPDQVEALVADFEAWKEASRAETEAYGETLDGRARFDLTFGGGLCLAVAAICLLPLFGGIGSRLKSAAKH